MNQRNNLLLLLFGVFALGACVKTEIIPETLPPQLRVEPASVSLTVGQTAQLTGTYTDETGEDQSAQIQWNTTAPAVVAVSAQGLLTAKTSGQGWIVATAPNAPSDSVLVTVIQDDNAVAKVVVTASQTVFSVGATLQLSAKAYNGNNQELPGQTATWASSNPNVFSISSSGLALGQNPGTASATASIAGVNSLPLTLQVTPVGGAARSGTFSGNMGYSVSGTATLQQTGSVLKLLLGNNFFASNGPMLGVYLAKNASGSLNSQNSLKLANLAQNTGAQEYPVPANVGLGDFDYVVIYCIPFNVRFGTASLQ